MDDHGPCGDPFAMIISKIIETPSGEEKPKEKPLLFHVKMMYLITWIVLDLDWTKTHLAKESSINNHHRRRRVDRQFTTWPIQWCWDIDGKENDYRREFTFGQTIYKTKVLLLIGRRHLKTFTQLSCGDPPSSVLHFQFKIAKDLFILVLISADLHSPTILLNYTDYYV